MTMFDRRTMLKGTLGAPIAIAPAFGLISEAHAQAASDYRALVCIYLEGGMDNWSALLPFDEANHARLAVVRPSLTFSRNQLAGTALSPDQELGGLQFALNPNLIELNSLFASGDLAIVQNTGALIDPVSKSQVLAGSARVPANLMSHNSQAQFVMGGNASSSPSGWGGRIADEVSRFNEQPHLTAMNAADSSPFLVGAATKPIAVGTSGLTPLLDGSTNLFGASPSAIRELTTASHTNPMKSDLSATMTTALETADLINPAFSQIHEMELSQLIGSDDEFGHQLATVARAIRAGPALGMRRQVFFVKMRGWDSHSMPVSELSQQFRRFDELIGNFFRLLRRWALAEAVTAFTLTDFGRTLVSNGDGTDHGWGGLSFVMGGCVNGRRLLGTAPEIALDGGDTITNGRLVPTTSIDELAGSLAHWMGGPLSRLTTVTPNKFFPGHPDGLLPLF